MSVMKWLILFTALEAIFSFPHLCAQENLVKNGDLSEIKHCPEIHSNISDALHWWRFDNYGSPDYLDQCVNTNNNVSTIPSTIGNQPVLSNSGYIHNISLLVGEPKNFFVCDPSNKEIQGRESFGWSFVHPLENRVYKIEFFVNFAAWGTSGFYNDGRVATNAFDLLLLDDSSKIYNSVSPFIDLDKVIKVHTGSNVINDTTNWVKLSTCFKARGGERFFAIGAFRDTNEIVLEFSGHSENNYYFSSYFFDDFSVYECPTCCPDMFPFSDSLTVASNPSTDGQPLHFEALLNVNATATLHVYDSAGRLVAIRSFTATEYTTELSDLASGMYHYHFVSSSGTKQSGKVIVSE